MKQDDAINPRHSAKQSRSQEIVSAIVTAGVQLLEDHGADFLTTSRIAERAGVSIGSLYRYYPNKQAVIAAIYEKRIDDEVMAVRQKKAASASFEDVSFHSAIRVFVDIAVDRHRRWLDLAPEFYKEYSESFSLGRKMGRTEDLMRRFLEKHRHELRVTDLDTASFIVARGLLSATLHIAVREKPQLLTSDTFAEELADTVISYLCGTGN